MFLSNLPCWRLDVGKRKWKQSYRNSKTWQSVTAFFHKIYRNHSYNFLPEADIHFINFRVVWTCVLKNGSRFYNLYLKYIMIKYELSTSHQQQVEISILAKKNQGTWYINIYMFKLRKYYISILNIMLKIGTLHMVQS